MHIWCLQTLELSSIWALLAAFEDPLPISQNRDFEGAFVKGVDSLSWMGNNTSKLFPLESDLPQCWTFFSTAAYGKRNKVPQVAKSLFFCTISFWLMQSSITHDSMLYPWWISCLIFLAVIHILQILVGVDRVLKRNLHEHTGKHP